MLHVHATTTVHMQCACAEHAHKTCAEAVHCSCHVATLPPHLLVHHLQSNGLELIVTGHLKVRSLADPGLSDDLLYLLLTQLVALHPDAPPRLYRAARNRDTCNVGMEMALGKTTPSCVIDTCNAKA